MLSWQSGVGFSQGYPLGSDLGRSPAVLAGVPGAGVGSRQVPLLMEVFSMKKRKPLSQYKSKRIFKKNTGVHKFNLNVAPMRGGIRA